MTGNLSEKSASFGSLLRGLAWSPDRQVKAPSGGRRSELPEAIGAYRILGILGRGGMGVVYRAEHLKTGEHAAIKTVRVRHARLLAGIRREIHALARLFHPGVVRILDEGMHEGLPWYAMELLEGVTLRRHITQLYDRAAEETTVAGWWTLSLDRSSSPPGPSVPAESMRYPNSKGRADLRPVLTLVRRLCAPLSFLHGEGIVHRDLKPENILVVSPREDVALGRPVLVDFGLAWQFGGEVSRDALEIGDHSAGTVAYMAPEQARGELVDARADLYALGCILYELLVGLPPFVAADARQVLAHHLETEPTPPSQVVKGVSQELDALVLRLLAKRPRDRLGYADDVAAALGRLGAMEGDETATPRARAYLYRPSLAGRQDELKSLEPALQRLDRRPSTPSHKPAGRGGLVLISGESGVGKTRLATELAQQAAARGLQVLTGECLAVGVPETSGTGGGGGSLHPLRRALNAVADRCRERGAREAERLLGRRAKVFALYEPALADLAGANAGSEPVELPAAAARLRLFTYLAQTFAALTDDSTISGSEAARLDAPLLLVLDDLQWADDLTLEWLEFLLQTGWLDRMLMLILGTYRTEDVGANHDSPLQRLAATEGVASIVLGRLDEDAVGAIVGDMLSLSPPPELFVRFLARQSEGNPFFVAEYLRTAVAEGILYRDIQGRWQVAEPGDANATVTIYEGLPLPSSLRALVARRLDGCSAPARHLVEAAAVLGRQVDEVLLAKMARIGGAGIQEAIEELLGRQILEEAGLGDLRFVHDKIREVAYRRLAPESHQELHRAAAAAIETLPEAERGRHLAALGHHWEQAGVRDEARRCYLAAARQATQRYALGQAERLYRAYQALVEQVSAESLEARNEIGSKVLVHLGRGREAIRELEQALEEARQFAERRVEGMLLRSLAAIHHLVGEMDEARALYEQALVLHREVGNRQGEGRTLTTLGLLHAEQGRLERAYLLHDQALAIQRDIGDREGEGLTLNNLANAHWVQGHQEEAAALYVQSVAASREAGDRRTEVHALGNLANIRRDQGRLEDSSALGERCLRISRELGERRLEAYALSHLAAVRMEQAGQVEEAVALMEQSLAINREVGNRRSMAVVLGNLAFLHRMQRRLEEARALLEEALVITREMQARREEAHVLANLAEVALDRGEPVEARELLDQAVAIQRELGNLTAAADFLRIKAGLERRTGALAEAVHYAAQAESVLCDSNAWPAWPLCVCEKGHQELARGVSAQALLDEAQALGARAGLAAQSEVGQALGRLHRAQEAFETGRPLFRGECVEDIPPELRRWLSETDQLAGGGVE